MSKLILILGGARSGKSNYAEQLAARLGRRVLYIATAEAHDDEMLTRIEAHQQARPAAWHTLEIPRDVGPMLQVNTRYRPDVLLLDCMTLLVSNIVLSLEAEPEAVISSAVEREVQGILAVHQQLNLPLIIVSNEVGLGLVPPYPIGRLYRDILGRANQQLATAADDVLFMVAGLPMTVKGNIEVSI